MGKVRVVTSILDGVPGSYVKYSDYQYLEAHLGDALDNWSTAQDKLLELEDKIAFFEQTPVGKIFQKNKELEAQLAEAKEGWYLANGVADLAMKHRDEAEAQLEAQLDAIAELPDKWEEDDPYSNEYERARQDGLNECANELQAIILEKNNGI